jgi:hypothetical protein
MSNDNFLYFCLPTEFGALRCAKIVVINCTF